jgi:hypothetical protein
MFIYELIDFFSEERLGVISLDISYPSLIEHYNGSFEDVIEETSQQVRGTNCPSQDTEVYLDTLLEELNTIVNEDLATEGIDFVKLVTIDAKVQV